MTGNQTATLKSGSAEMEVLYEWPKGSSLVLLDFAERVLWQHHLNEKRALQQRAVAAAAETLKHLFRVEATPREYRDIRYRSDDGNMRSLTDDLVHCAKWLQEEGRRQAPLPLKPTHWIIWNLAPFFRKKASDPIAWRDLVRFLNCVSFSARLAGRTSPAASKPTILARQAKRMATIYKRTPIDIPRDVKIQRVLHRHFRHRTNSPNKALHDRAFQTLSRLTS